VITYEKRKHERKELKRVVQAVTVDDSRVPIECTLLDISQTGARLYVENAGELPSEFLLVLSDDVKRWCRTVRRMKTDVGVKFIRERRA
jgi:hypothetical protein